MDIALIKILEYYDHTFRNNDIIQVKYNYTDDEDDAIEDEIIGRLHDIFEDCVVVDISTEHNAEMIFIYFEDIIDIVEVSRWIN